jgi:ABC-type microcin C transport system permease subunit YejE
MARRRPVNLSMALALVLALAGCAKTLPEEDRRITLATPIVKTTTEILWKEYLDNPAEAKRKYFGQAIEVAGKVTAFAIGPDSHSFVMFEQKDPPAGPGVQANLLDDQAAEIMASSPIGTRLRLKCFAEGLSGNLILRSCVRP